MGRTQKVLPNLISGQQVFIQNQKAAGKLAKRWDKTGVVLEDHGFDKYSVKVDGSLPSTKKSFETEPRDHGTSAAATSVLSV